MYPFCSIIVLNYNGERFIEKTLDSLRRLHYPNDRYEVIVVDNKSTDKSNELINKYLIHNSQLATAFKQLPLNKNLGFSGGNNEGIKIAKGQYVILLNNDCIVDPDWLTELIKIAEKDKHIFAVGSKTYLRDTGKIQNAGILMFEDGYGRDVGAIVKNNTQDYVNDEGQFDTEYEPYAACAVAVLYRKSILDEIGLLDDSSFMYYEDVELSERARMHGYKIKYAPLAKVFHHHAASSGEWSPFFIYHSEYGRLWHMFFWFPQHIFWREYLKFVVKAKLRVLYGLKNNEMKKQIQYLRVAWNFFLNFPKLYALRKEKLKNIDVILIEQNYQSVKKNIR